MAVGEIQISALPQATLPIELSDIFHLKQGIEDKRCTLEQLLDPHASLRNNPHGVTKVQVELGNVVNALQLVAANNLSDVVDVAEARANLQIMSSDEVNQIIQNHIDDKNNPHNTTKTQVGLGNVQNWLASNAYNEDADKYATARAVNSLYRAVQASYPIGTIHLSVNAANPSTYLICGGTWELMAQGRTLVGYDSTVPSRPVNTQFGSAQVSLNVNNLPQHSHSVNLSGGGHTHGASVSIQSFDYGTKTSSSFDYGTKTTNSAGAHTHTVGGNSNSAGSHRHDLITGRNDDDYYHAAGNRKGHVGNGYTASYNAGQSWLGWAGDHTHTFSGTAASAGAHTHTVVIGSHTHSIGIGSHTHNATATISSSEHTHSGNTNNTGGNQAFSIEQPSIVVYIWKRVA